MAEKKKSRWAGIFIGPVIVFLALTAIWKNETRFDYHRAAAATAVIDSTSQATSGQLLSLTGSMDQGMTMPGQYVESFTGYLTVWRSAEIYCWDKDEDDDGVKWSKRWMSSVESNSRNSGIRQKLSSEQLMPKEYTVGELQVDSSLMEFVDSAVCVNPSQLTLTRKNLSAAGEYFMLYKKRSDGMGDERVSYSAIPVPTKATYFGKYEGSQGVADTTNKRTGFVNAIIQDTGILHHIVAGDRTTALATMKAHIGRLKWIVRGIASVVVIVGLLLLFSTFVSFLFPIPIIGRIAETGVFLLSLAIGIPLILITMTISYLVAHPLILVLILGGAAGSFYWLRRRGKNSQQAIKNQLDQEYGHILPLDEVKELEFIELARLAARDGEIKDAEKKFLKAWAKQHRWDQSKFETMLSKANRNSSEPDTGLSEDDHLTNLVRLSLADGNVTSYELKAIRRMANQLGYDNKTVSDLMNRVRQSAMNTSVQPA